ncbi:MAG: HDOD domain-containing protein [Planctomycetota bacterium]|jgi:HD-like signal output (HDOD) protein
MQPEKTVDYTLDAVWENLAENMPSLSPTSAKVIELANDINCPPAELTRVIKLDPVLSGKVLKLVNSPYFGLSSKISSLEKAVIMAGVNTIKNLALAAAVLSQVETEEVEAHFEMRAFWKHCVAVGVIAKLLGVRQGVDKKEAEAYFVAGLLHDLGLLVESQMYPEEMAKVMVPCRFLGLVESEETVLGGLNHCSIGKLLAEHWGLAPELVDVIENHHTPGSDTAMSRIVLTVIVANVLAQLHSVGLVLDAVDREVLPGLFEALQLSPDCEGEVMEALEEELRKAMEIIKV